MNLHNEQHDPRPELELDDELLALDAELRRVMPIEASRDLIERLQVAAGAYDPSLDAELRSDLAAGDGPAVNGLADVDLDTLLRESLPAAIPAGLADRIHSATTPELGATNGPVLARIGWAQRGAIAAALLLAAGLFAYYMDTPETITPEVPTPPFVVDEAFKAQVEQVAEVFDTSLETYVMEDEIDSIEAELDAVMVVLAFGDSYESYASQFIIEINAIESALD